MTKQTLVMKVLSHGLRCVKLEFHGSSFLVASSYHFRDILADTRDIIARMSRECYEETASVEVKIYGAARCGAVCAA